MSYKNIRKKTYANNAEHCNFGCHGNVRHLNFVDVVDAVEKHVVLVK